MIVRNKGFLYLGLLTSLVSASLIYLALSNLAVSACKVLLFSFAIVLIPYSAFLIKASTEKLPPSPEELEKAYKEELQELMEELKKLGINKEGSDAS